MLSALLRALLWPPRLLDLLTLGWAMRRRGSVPPRLSQPHLAWRQETHHRDAERPPGAKELLRFAQWRRRTLRR